MGAGGQGATPVLVSVRAPLGSIRSALIGVGALAQDHRSVALDLGDDLLLLSYDDREHATTIAVGGGEPLKTGRWLAEQLEDLGLRIVEISPVAPSEIPVP
ncbi:hypothetical protein ACVW00_001639 [Marmoricola sp. URHA0025 HA25]